jgi:hypothetical protein
MGSCLRAIGRFRKMLLTIRSRRVSNGVLCTHHNRLARVGCGTIGVLRMITVAKADNIRVTIGGMAQAIRTCRHRLTRSLVKRTAEARAPDADGRRFDLALLCPYGLEHLHCALCGSNDHIPTA